MNIIPFIILLLNIEIVIIKKVINTGALKEIYCSIFVKVKDIEVILYTYRLIKYYSTIFY